MNAIRVGDPALATVWANDGMDGSASVAAMLFRNVRRGVIGVDDLRSEIGNLRFEI
jgi:hypothetical protein